MLDGSSRKQSKLVSVTAEQTFAVAPVVLWPLWTTAEGFQSWWSPEGFVLEILGFDPRPGGRIDLRYEEAAAARNPAWREEVRSNGLATSWTARGTFRQVDRMKLVSFQQALDFGPRSAPQDYRLAAEFLPLGTGTRVRLEAQAPASKHWTLLGKQNLVGQLKRLGHALATGTE
jgi:uncharacterized protein YndB with AHSA1/START domain